MLRPTSLVLPLSILFLLVACGSSDRTPTTSPGPYYTQPDASAFAGGLMGPTYEEPIPITSGDYWPEDVDYAAARERFQKAALATGPHFDGEVAGFRIAPPEVLRGEKQTGSSCDGAEIELVEKMKFRHLPPGTSAGGPQYQWVCRDGSVPGGSQFFQTVRGWFLVSFSTGQPMIRQSIPRDLVHEASFGGKTGVIVDPVVIEGIGPSYAGFSTEGWYIRVQASDLPATELVKLVEGIDCDDCQ